MLTTPAEMLLQEYEVGARVSCKATFDNQYRESQSGSLQTLTTIRALRGLSVWLRVALLLRVDMLPSAPVLQMRLM